VVALLVAGALVERVHEGMECEVVLDTTPFYPEGGGQMGDRGAIKSASGRFTASDTQAAGGAIVHRGTLAEGELAVGDVVEATVEYAWRRGATSNHTSTHMLHAALRETLGTHVRQQGSLVSAERLRFDFTHLEQVPREALREVETLANDRIRDDLAVTARLSSYPDAVASGALAFFGDKYGGEVRVVEIGTTGERFSAELCGGTHVHHTGELGFVHIVREAAVAAGTRRIEALSGRQAEQYLVDQHERLLRAAAKLNTTPAGLDERIDQLQADLENLRRQAARLEAAQGSSLAEALAGSALQLNGHRAVVARVDLQSNEALNEMADVLRSKLHSALIVLAAVIDGRPALLVAATPDLVSAGVHAGNLVREIAEQAGGKGGGRPDIARGSGDMARLDDAVRFATGKASDLLGSL
jgi:alanyl-tRNA synthetase